MSTPWQLINGLILGAAIGINIICWVLPDVVDKNEAVAYGHAVYVTVDGKKVFKWKEQATTSIPYYGMSRITTGDPGTVLKQKPDGRILWEKP